MEVISEVLLTTGVFLVTTVITVFITYIAKWWQYNKKYFDLAAKLQKPIGVSYYPLIGHGHHFTKFQALVKIAKCFNSPYGVAYIGSLISFFLNDAEVLEEFLQNDKCMDKPKYLNTFHTFQNGLFLSNGDRWRKHRKLINPVFNQRMLNSYVNVFWKHDNRFIEQLKDKVGHTFDITHLSKRLSFAKFFDFALGLDAGQKSDEFFDALEILLSIQYGRVMNFLQRLNIFFNFTKARKDVDESVRTIKRISLEVIDEKLRKRAEEKGQLFSQVEDTKNVKFLDYLLDCADDNGKPFTSDDVVDELLTLLVAGIETCATTFSFVCVCLGLHPDLQEKAYNEIYDVLGPDAHVQHTDLRKLKYLETIVKETMRMFPVGALVPRSPADDVKIGEHVFPEGSTIHLNVISIHYSDKYYKDPFTFNPDRFLPEEVQKRHKYAYIPFSAGKRSCIAEKFANMALITTVATFLRKYRVETTYTNLRDIHLEMSPLTTATNGFPIRIFPRD